MVKIATRVFLSGRLKAPVCEVVLLVAVRVV